MSYETVAMLQTVAMWGAGISLAIALFAICLHVYIMFRAVRLAKKEHVRREALRKSNMVKRFKGKHRRGKRGHA